ncbi:site-specific DNA-methyltransferase [Aquibacillus sp. 3ASR75-11]|uniref:Site-specific DNA-methyltransferase n=1 Tax=Terrihalobacillus insolitus TaxID=2950438 RepID=A0A9X4ANH5_9BACI|nr:site-specific DNA-methyltransferase [Terrihalobacillus insolitus]MDC3415107.1 site-specific DNA-methyltransferase [Terrihalobacillus insolitus]MDC3425829.1 site-specific DNA-methyltransferase [Terrihalobacillus insolitus]
MSEFNLNQEETNIEKYEFEPIKGYPMLNWKGKRPFRSTQYYPAQLKETHGETVDGWLNKIFWGDNLQVMSHLLKEYRGIIDLIYIDPPFDSNADYKKKIKLKGKALHNDLNSFEEVQYSDLWSNDEYLQFMYERLILMRELLSDRGTIYLHCDYRKLHHLKCIMDEIFGSSNYRSEIIWKKDAVGKGAKKKAKYWPRTYDVIIAYSKTDNPIFHIQDGELTEKQLKEFRYEDPDGRKFKRTTLGDYSENSIKEMERTGHIYISSTGKKYKKYYLDEYSIPMDSIWTDIPGFGVATSSKELTKYPTQKPEQILERIIKSSSNEDSIVFDCFMGSGTTQSVALKTGRKFVGTDINLAAVQTTTKRLIKNYNESDQELPGFEVYNVNHYEIFRNPAQAKEILKEALEVQTLVNNSIYDGEKDGRMVKVMPVNRIATKADLNELITNFDYKMFEQRQAENPTQPVEKLLIVCMGHEPDLAAALEQEVGYKLDVEIVDLLRDKSNLEFRRDSEADIIIENGRLIINNFYPMNLLQKLSLMKDNVEDWKELVESVMIDWNYDGAVLEPSVVDIPGNEETVNGIYEVPKDAGTIRVKITDLLSESLEVSVKNG